MNSSEFVHLHLHTDYSFLDSLIRIPVMVEKAKELGMKALAITDHSNLCGAMEFAEVCAEAGIKPIIGCEVNVAPRVIKKRGRSVDELCHLVLLCRDMEGYQNLCKLITAGWVDGSHNNPRIAHELLEKHGKGLIALSGCARGEIPRMLLSDRGPAKWSEQEVEWLQSVFGKENFYLEVQFCEEEHPAKLNRYLHSLSLRTGAPLVCTNNCHYLEPEDAPLREALWCIAHNRKLHRPGNYGEKGQERYFRSGQEMAHFCGIQFEGAMRNTLAISEKCDFKFDFTKLHLPDARAEQKGSADEELARKARAGLAKQMPFLKQKGPLFAAKASEYKRRLESELKAIKQGGVANYFLMADEVMDFARERDIAAGPGRAATLGSLVYFALGITKLDPIEHGLIFERFFNPRRDKLPSLHIDFDANRRSEIVSHLIEKYGGAAKVSPMIILHKMQAHGALHHVGRVLDLPFLHVEEVRKQIPLFQDIDLAQAFSQIPQLKQMRESDPSIAELFNLAIKIEGLFFNPGINAAAVVIADRPLTEYLPLYKIANCYGEDILTTQFAGEDLAKLGLAIFDFLGANTFSNIDRCEKLVEEKHGRSINIDSLPLDDKKTWELFARGDTDGVYFLEQEFIAQLLRQLQPENLAQLAAVHALSQPGPLRRNIPELYIQRKSGAAKIPVLHPVYDEITKETFGLLLYQEQAMKVLHKLAGFPMDNTYQFLKELAGAKPEAEAQFLERCSRRKVPKEKARAIWKELANPGYPLFIKAHALSCALISYQTAWLKTHFPEEFTPGFAEKCVGAPRL